MPEDTLAPNDPLAEKLSTLIKRLEDEARELVNLSQFTPQALGLAAVVKYEVADLLKELLASSEAESSASPREQV